MLKKIKEVIVVEGKTDSLKLKTIFDVDTIETNGQGLNQETIEFIKKINKTKGIILFLDPDGPGEQIRKKIQSEIGLCKNAFIDKKEQIYTKKVGIAETPIKSIIKALNNVITFDTRNNSITWEEYISLNINNKNKRKFICDKFSISYCNNKQLFKRLNMMNIKKEEIN